VTPLRRLWRWLSGANRRGPRLSAMDVAIAQRDRDIADLTRQVEAYEERVRLMRGLPEARRNGGQHE